MRDKYGSTWSKQDRRQLVKNRENMGKRLDEQLDFQHSLYSGLFTLSLLKNTTDLQEIHLQNLPSKTGDIDASSQKCPPTSAPPIQHVNVLANLMVIGQQGRSPGKFAMLEISEKYVWIHEKSRYYITTCHGHAFQSLHAPFFESSRLQTHGSPEVPLLNESRFKWPGPWCPWHTKTGEDVRKYLSDPLRVSTEHLHLFPLTHPDFGGIILVSCDMCLHSGSCSWHCEWI